MFSPTFNNDFVMIMAAALFLIGVISVAAGIIVMFRKVMGNEIRDLAEQTTKLAQKGIAEDVSGLVGNASSLVSNLNSLVRSSAGVGLVLTIIGFVMMAASYYLVLQIL